MLKRTLLRYFNNCKTRTKLILIYVIAGIIPILILGTVSIYNIRTNMILFETSQSYTKTAALKKNIFDITFLCSNLSKIISTDDSLKTLLSSDFSNEEDIYNAYRNCKLLDMYTSYYTEVADICIYTANSSLFDYGRFRTVTPDIEASDWFQRALTSSGQIFWIYDTQISNYSNVHLVKYIGIPQADTYAVLMISISNNYLDTILQDNHFHIFLALNTEQIVRSSSLRESGNPLPFAVTGKSGISETYPVIYDQKKVMAQDVTVTAVNSNDHFQIVVLNNCYETIQRTIFTFLLIIIIAVLFPLLMIILFTSLYSKRLNTVRDEMHKIAQGNLNIADSFAGKDELGELFEDMKITINSIQELNERIYCEQLRQQELENQHQQIRFELLSSQINPHFLFNTLESIRMQAAIDGNTELTSIIMQLGKMLRFSLESKNEPVPLSHELKYLQAYFDIQRFRFQDRIRSYIHIQPQLNTDCIIVLPLLLQPFVENAFSHGFPGKKEGGMININIMKRDQNLTIQIHDNGVGISEQNLHTLLTRMQNPADNQRTGIGICNVQNRIRLYYGNDYGISISSQVGEGTTITIKLPYCEELKYEIIDH